MTDIKTLLEFMFGDMIDWDRFMVMEIQTVQNKDRKESDPIVYETRLLVTIEEKNEIPDKLKNKGTLVSHGFYEPEYIRDFPLRDKAVTLIIKKRRWKVKETQEIVSSGIEIKYKKTEATRSLLDFLK